MAIDPRFIVNLKGKDVPLYAGVLDAATKAGLKSLTTELIQIPHPDNGHCAIVKAQAEFEDGRVFVDYGDCSPANTSPQIASAAIRMASTRAKGRALRDAINCGMTLREELPDDDYQEPAQAQRNGRQAQAQPQQRASAQNGPANAPQTRQTGQAAEGGAMVCSADGCGKPLTKGQYDVSLRAYGQPLCPACQKAAAATRAA